MTGPCLHQTRDTIPQPEIRLLASLVSQPVSLPGVIVPSPGYRLWGEELSGAPLGHVTLVDAHLIAGTLRLITDGGEIFVLFTL